MAYTITNVYALDPTYTGASLRAQLYSSTNVAVGSAISTGFYERAGAQGVFAHAMSVPDDHVGWCDVYDNAAPSVVLVSFPINPRELEYSDQKSSLLAPAATALSTTQWTNVRAELLDYLDAAIGSRLASASYTAPDNATIAGINTKLGTPAGASVSADIASIQADTNDLQTSAAQLVASVEAILADTGTDGVAIATAAMNAIADAVLGRSVANVQDTASIYTIAGLILAQFESSAPGTTWTIFKTDGVTAFSTRSLVEDERAKPVVGIS